MKQTVSEGIIGIDVGTSVIKTVLYDRDGELICTVSETSTVQRPKSLWAECDMDDVWQKVASCLCRLVSSMDMSSSGISGIGITGQGDGTWLVDSSHRPVRPAVTWLDGRTGDAAARLHADGTAEELFKITGTSVNSSSQAVQLRWLKEHEPQSLKSAAASLRAKDWIFLKLTGVVSTDTSDASYTFFDIRKNCYDQRVLDLHGIADLAHLLPPASPPSSNIAELTPEAAAATGLPKGIPVVCGPFDVSACAIGVGAVSPGDGNTIFGTAGIHQIIIDDPPGPPENIGYTIAHGPEGTWLRLLPSKTGTLNVQWFVEQFYGSDAYDEDGKIAWKRIEDELQSIPVGSHGVLYHPYIDPSGERAPFVDPFARAQFSGVHLNHTRDTLLHAAFEGVVLSAMDCYAYLPFQPKEVRLSGGGSRSAFWSQMFADAVGSPVRHVMEKETGTKGAMISTGVALGWYDSYTQGVEQTCVPGKLFTPDSALKRDYEALLKIYRNTYEAMRPIWKQLHQFVSRQ